MKKNSSTGNLYLRNSGSFSKISFITERISKRPVSAKTNFSKIKKSQSTNHSIHHNLPNLFSSNSTYNISFSNNNNSQREHLYEEVIQLKKQINFLKSEISLIKSDNQKKENELLLKEKEIDNFFEDNKSSNTNIPINVEKLKDSNSISKLKKGYFELKKIYLEKENEYNDLKNQIKNAKPFNTKFENEVLQKKLINLVEKYQTIQRQNNINDILLKNLSILPSTFSENHIKIQNLQNNLDNKKNKIQSLKDKLNNLRQLHSDNTQKIKKQNLNKINLNKHNDKMLNDKKSKEEIIKMKSSYEKQIKELNNKLKEYQNKCSNNDKIIKEIEDSNEKIRIDNQIDRTKLKQFDYSHLIFFEKNPNENSNQKVSLLKSLLNESFTKRKKLIKIIEDYIEKLKALGCDASLIGGDNGNISERNIGDPSSVNANNSCSKNEENQNNNNQENKQHEEEKKNDNINEEKKQNENNSEKLEEKKNENEEEKLNNNNKNLEILKEEETNKIEENQNKNNPISNSILQNNDFSEFTYVIIKNFEAKKISQQKAKELIIDKLPTNSNNHNEISNIMANKIIEILECTKKEDKEKIVKWINTLYMMSNNDQMKANENYLSLFSNIKTYSPEEELILKKKVKKSLLPFKDLIKSKLNTENGFVSFLYLKKIMEEQKIEMKDDYAQFLFYQMKQFDEKNISLYDLKVDKLFEILNNTEHDSKMDTESDIEISNDEYFEIITNFTFQLSNVLKEKNLNLKDIFKDVIDSLHTNNPNEILEVVTIENFINKMKEIGIEIKSDLEIYCLFSRYKVSDDYEVISIDLLQKELENYKSLTQIQNNNVGEKVMENVEEVNEENITN